jgi:hypothetical protein
VTNADWSHDSAYTPTTTPKLQKIVSSSASAAIRTSGSRTGTLVSGSAIAIRPAPISSARTAPPRLSPTLTSQARIGEASTSLM